MRLCSAIIRDTGPVGRQHADPGPNPWLKRLSICRRHRSIRRAWITTNKGIEKAYPARLIPDSVTRHDGPKPSSRAFSFVPRLMRPGVSDGHIGPGRRRNWRKRQILVPREINPITTRPNPGRPALLSLVSHQPAGKHSVISTKTFWGRAAELS